MYSARQEVTQGVRQSKSKIPAMLCFIFLTAHLELYSSVFTDRLSIPLLTSEKGVQYNVDNTKCIIRLDRGFFLFIFQLKILILVNYKYF